MRTSDIENLPLENSPSQDLGAMGFQLYRDLQLSTQHEYFLAIVKQKWTLHNSLMLGVVDQGIPVLLTHVGKFFHKDRIDKDDSYIKLTYEALLNNGIPAYIHYEGIGRISTNIAYQAYSITLKQLIEFLHMLQNIEKEILNETKIDRYRRIKSYVPVKRNDEQLTFRWNNLANISFKNTDERKVNPGIIKDAQSLQFLNNDCRKTAVDILNTILEVDTKVSKNCFSALAYETTWAYARLNEQTFYILPSPPPATSDKLTKNQLKTLHKLYARLQEIPKLNPGSKETREKFNALKEMYNGIAVEENLDVPTLLDRIQKHENKNKTALYQNRGYFPFFNTTTQRMLDNIKSDLEYKSNRPSKSF